MAAIMQSREAKARLKEAIRREFIWKPIIKGVLSIKQILSTTTIGTVLEIETSEKPNEVFVNGERYKKEDS